MERRIERHAARLERSSLAEKCSCIFGIPAIHGGKKKEPPAGGSCATVDTTQ
jgi:hypothetical protein